MTKEILDVEDSKYNLSNILIGDKFIFKKEYMTEVFILSARNKTCAKYFSIQTGKEYRRVLKTKVIPINLIPVIKIVKQ